MRLSIILSWAYPIIKKRDLDQFEANLLEFRQRAKDQDKKGPSIPQRLIGTLLDPLLAAQFTRNSALDLVTPTLEKVLPLYRQWVAAPSKGCWVLSAT